MTLGGRKKSENVIDLHEEIYKTRNESEMVDGSTKDINMGYLSFLIFGVALGNVQFGFMIGGWNAASGIYG